MPIWVCPQCHRHFARQGQGHECAPAMSLDEYFSTGPERERPIFDAVMAHLDTVGPVHVEPVSVGLFLKRGAGAGKFAELRPKVRWEALLISLPRLVRHPRFTSKPMGTGARVHHSLRLYGPDDVDDLVRDWLTEAYFAATPD